MRIALSGPSGCGKTTLRRAFCESNAREDSEQASVSRSLLAEMEISDCTKLKPDDWLEFQSRALAAQLALEAGDGPPVLDRSFLCFMILGRTTLVGLYDDDPSLRSLYELVFSEYLAREYSLLEDAKTLPAFMLSPLPTVAADGVRPVDEVWHERANFFYEEVFYNLNKGSAVLGAKNVASLSRMAKATSLGWVVTQKVVPRLAMPHQKCGQIRAVLPGARLDRINEAYEEEVRRWKQR